MEEFLIDEHIMCYLYYWLRYAYFLFFFFFQETGGIALPIKKTKAKVENDFVKFEKTTLPKPAFFRKAKRSITAMPVW